MHEAVAGDVCQGLAQHRLDPDTVEIAHRVHERVELRQRFPLGRVERTDSDEGDAAPLQRGQAILRALELRTGQAQRGRQRHPVDVAARRGLGPVQVGMSVEPEHASRPERARKPAKGPQRDRVIPAENERH